MDFSIITDEPLNYCVYAHINKQNGKMYIGITNNINQRWSSNGLQYKGCNHFYNAVLKYGWDSFEHIIIISNISVSMANEIEKQLIKKYNTINSGYNIKSGGEGGGELGKNHHKSKPLYQYDLDGNFIKKWECPIDAEKYYNVRDLTKVPNKINGRKMAIGYQWSYEYVEKMQPYTHAGYTRKDTPIYQYTIDGKFIKKWDKQKDAFDEYSITIRGCAYGTYKTSHGYRWSFEYKEELSPLQKTKYSKRNTIPSNAISVIQKTNDGEIVATYPSATSAIKQVSNNKSKNQDIILKACKNNTIAYGYLWEFANQEVR